MHKILTLIICMVAYCNFPVVQSKMRIYYRPVNIDSLLKQKIILPKSKTISISNIEFTTLFSGEIHRDGGAMRLAVKRDSSKLSIKYSGTAALFKNGDSIFSGSLARESLLELLKPFDKIKRIKVNARMIIYQVKKDDIRRGFLVEDISAVKD